MIHIPEKNEGGQSHNRSCKDTRAHPCPPQGLWDRPRVAGGRVASIYFSTRIMSRKTQGGKHHSEPLLSLEIWLCRPGDTAQHPAGKHEVLSSISGTKNSKNKKTQSIWLCLCHPTQSFILKHLASPIHTSAGRNLIPDLTESQGKTFSSEVQTSCGRASQGSRTSRLHPWVDTGFPSPPTLPTREMVLQGTVLPLAACCTACGLWPTLPFRPGVVAQ